MKKNISLFLAVLMISGLAAGPVYAQGIKEGASSLLLPTTGQALNGQIHETKTKVMAGVEVASITAVAILGTVTSGPIIWAGLGPLLANHTWSAVDAYKTAKNKPAAMMDMQMNDPQRTLEYARVRRYQGEEQARGDLRARVQQAAEMGYKS